MATSADAASGWLSVVTCSLLAGLSAAATGAAIGFTIAGSEGARMLGSVAGALIPMALIVLERTRSGA